MATKKQLVLVLGEDNDNKIDERYVWDYYHFHPTRNENPGPVTAVFFHFPKLERRTWNRYVPINRQPPRGKPDEVVKIEPVIRDPGDNRERSSVLGLYDWIKAQERGSIIALHVFSHGFPGGPVLWMKPEDHHGDVTQPRLATDTELRIRDFYGSNPLAKGERTKFNGAFSDNALIKLWGCYEEQPQRTRVAGYIAARRRGDEASRFCHLYNYLLDINASFAMHMARALNRTIWAAPVGWGTDPNFDGSKERDVFPPDLARNDRWWRAGVTFTKVWQDFFRRDLRAPLDATLYAGYAAGWVDEAFEKIPRPARPAGVPTPRELQQRLQNAIPRIGSSPG